METIVGLRRFLDNRQILHTGRKGRFIEVVFAPTIPGGSRERRLMDFDEYERRVEKRTTSSGEDDVGQPGNTARSR